LEVRASEEHKHWLPFFRSPPLRGAQALRVTLRRWRGWGSEWLPTVGDCKLPRHLETKRAHPLKSKMTPSTTVRGQITIQRSARGKHHFDRLGRWVAAVLRTGEAFEGPTCHNALAESAHSDLLGPDGRIHPLTSGLREVLLQLLGEVSHRVDNSDVLVVDQKAFSSWPPVAHHLDLAVGPVDTDLVLLLGGSHEQLRVRVRRELADRECLTVIETLRHLEGGAVVVVVTVAQFLHYCHELLPGDGTGERDGHESERVAHEILLSEMEWCCLERR
jgi:hypothetical protein